MVISADAYCCKEKKNKYTRLIGVVLVQSWGWYKLSKIQELIASGLCHQRDTGICNKGEPNINYWVQFSLFTFND